MRRAWLRAIMILALMVPAVAVPAVPRAAPAATEAHEAGAGGEVGAVTDVVASDPGTSFEPRLIRLDAAGEPATRVMFQGLDSMTLSTDADLEISASQQAQPLTAFTFGIQAMQSLESGPNSLRDADFAAPSVQADTEPSESPVAVLWLATAQGTIAALGGAMHASSGPVMVREVSMGPVAVQMPAELAMAPPADWLAAAFWAVFLTALGALAAPRLFGIASWALYARLVQGQMERHPRRALVMALIRQDPGASLRVLEIESGIAGGVLRHHLDQLERHGLARHLRNGRTTHWFPESGLPLRAPPTKTQRRVMAAIAQSPGVTASELATLLGTSAQNAWKQLRRLGESRLVRSERDGRRLRWALVP